MATCQRTWRKKNTKSGPTQISGTLSQHTPNLYYTLENANGGKEAISEHGIALTLQFPHLLWERKLFPCPTSSEFPEVCAVEEVIKAGRLPVLLPTCSSVDRTCSVRPRKNYVNTIKIALTVLSKETNTYD